MRQGANDEAILTTVDDLSQPGCEWNLFSVPLADPV
jgi:hypothetical protein